MLKEMHWNFNFQTQFSATSYFLYIISSCVFILGLFGFRSLWFALTYACAIHNNQLNQVWTKETTGASGGGVGSKYQGPISEEVYFQSAC